MGDENFDPCECIWSHQMAMRRLLSLLRQSQSHCTDTECFQDGNNPLLNSNNTETDHGFIIMSMIFAFAMLMYFLRPQQQQSSNPQKSNIRDNDSNGPHNPPPTSC